MRERIPKAEKLVDMDASLEEELERVRVERQKIVSGAKDQPRLTPKNTSNHTNPKALFPLKNRYKKKIQSLQGQGKYDEARVWVEAHKDRIQNASAPTWVWEGKQIDRFKLMKILVERIAAGDLLVDICNGKPGVPSIQTIYAWQKEHPDFEKAMKMAKEVQAQVFADRALKAVCDEDDPKAASLAKNKHDGLMKRAALQSADFRERQAAPPEPDKPQSLEEMQAQLLQLLQADPNILPVGVADALRASMVPKPTLPSSAQPITIEAEEAVDVTLGEQADEEFHLPSGGP